MKDRLYKELEEFTKNGLPQEERQKIVECDKDESLQSTYCPETFQKIATHIVNGYFLVKDNTKEIKVIPTCVEIYYHEEAEGGIKDPIVYHRNTKSDPNKPVFGLGILHNHVSGIDITFEHEDKSGQAVRASALIREFRAEGIDKFKDVEDRSTYLYEALFSQFNIFDGFSIEWHDELEEKYSVTHNIRKNVSKFMADNKTKMLASGGKKYVQCPRMWQFKVQ